MLSRPELQASRSSSGIRSTREPAESQAQNIEQTQVLNTQAPRGQWDTPVSSGIASVRRSSPRPAGQDRWARPWNPQRGIHKLIVSFRLAPWTLTGYSEGGACEVGDSWRGWGGP